MPGDTPGDMTGDSPGYAINYRPSQAGPLAITVNQDEYTGTMRIAEIRDPNLFQRLVRTLFAAERGHNFQIVDDSSGDRGNDGYDAEAGILLAIYCPEKGMDAQRTLEKGRTDLKKAVQLLTDAAYVFNKWYFVTPQPLLEKTQATLRAEALSHGLSATFTSAENLETIFLAHPDLHDLFPELTYPRIQEALREVSVKLDRIEEHLSSPTIVSASAKVDAEAPPEKEADLGYTATLFAGFQSDELTRIQEALAGGGDAARFELERYRLQATSVRDRLVALMIECEYEQDQLNFPGLEKFAKEGWELAQSIGAKAEAAVFGARLGLARKMVLVAREFDLYSRLGTMGITGAPLVSTEEAERYDRDVPKAKAAVDELFRQAHLFAKESRNLLSLFTVALLYASSVTQGIFPLRIPGREKLDPSIPKDIEHAIEVVHSAYDLAISIATALNSKRLTAMAFTNYANDLRTFGDERRALHHAQYALRLAKELGDAEQLTKAARLVQQLTRSLNERL
jgi:hypothetical protein